MIRVRELGVHIAPSLFHFNNSNDFIIFFTPGITRAGEISRALLFKGKPLIAISNVPSLPLGSCNEDRRGGHGTRVPRGTSCSPRPTNI